MTKRLTPGRSGVSLWQVRRGSFIHYYNTCGEAMIIARKMRDELLETHRTGVVKVLKSTFKLPNNHHWRTCDVIDLLNGKYGWSLIAEFAIQKGLVTRYLDKSKRTFNAEVTEQGARIAMHSPDYQEATDYVMNDEVLRELLIRAPTMNAFVVAINRIDAMKPPLNRKRCRFIWNWYHV